MLPLFLSLPPTWTAGSRDGTAHKVTVSSSPWTLASHGRRHGGKPRRQRRNAARAECTHRSALIEVVGDSQRSLDRTNLGHHWKWDRSTGARATEFAVVDLADQVFERFRPQVLLTYGGHPVSLELMRRAHARGIAVVFHLHNFGYNDRRAFDHVSAIIFPSEYSRRFHQRRLGLDGVAIPYRIRLDRVIAGNPAPTYVTLINPQLDKGLTVFARIALELNERRPEIPLLGVAGRGTAEALAMLPVELSGLANLNRMANTPDPRDFYRVSRAVLMPSLWRESLGRVAVEAMANGIPVLASNRGALPETLGDAGFLFTLPERCTPASAAVPTAREVGPWVATIERLWDDADFEARHRALSRAEARRWDWERVGDQYQQFFEGTARRLGNHESPADDR